MRLSLLLFTFMLAACSTAPSSETAAYPTLPSDNRPTAHAGQRAASAKELTPYSSTMV